MVDGRRGEGPMARTERVAGPPATAALLRGRDRFRHGGLSEAARRCRFVTETIHRHAGNESRKDQGAAARSGD